MYSKDILLMNISVLLIASIKIGIKIYWIYGMFHNFLKHMSSDGGTKNTPSVSTEEQLDHLLQKRLLLIWP